MSQSSQPASATPEHRTGASTATIDASCCWPLLGLYHGAACWLLASAVAYLVASLSFHAPALFAECAWLSYGRMAPVANNLLLYGFCIPAGWAAALWMLARLGQTPLAHGASVIIGAKLWNLGVLAGALGILIGGSSGYENLEFPVYAAWLLWLGSIFIGISALNTLRSRAERDLHPIQWFAGLGMLWFPWTYLTAVMFLEVWPLRGMAQGAVHWWTLANLQVVLLGLLGVAALFYFLPVFRQRPLPSRLLALFALLSFVLCGGWTGVPPTAPAPAWLATLSQVMSVCLILPVLAVVLSLWNLRSGQSTAETRYLGFGSWLLILWTGLWVVINGFGLARFAAFTLIQPALNQLLLQGFSLMISLGVAYTILPRITGRALPFPKFVPAHFWLATAGLTLVVVPFLLSGVRQGSALADAAIPFTEVAAGTLMPIRVATLGQLLLILGHSLLGANVGILIFGLVRDRVKRFDNSPAELMAAKEAGA